MDRVGIANPTIEVRFEHLNVSREAYIGGRSLPTVFNVTVNVLEGLLNTLHILPSQKTRLSNLHDVSGIIKPGRDVEGTVKKRDCCKYQARPRS